MATIKIVMLRPVPIWNFVIRPERVIEIEEDIGKHLIARGCAKDQATYQADAAKRKELKAREKAEAEAKAKEEAEAKTAEAMPESEPPKRKKKVEV